MSLQRDVLDTSSDADASLESLINREYQKLLEATTPRAQRDAWHSMRSLIASRSPQRIARMERAQKLQLPGKGAA